MTIFSNSNNSPPQMALILVMKFYSRLYHLYLSMISVYRVLTYKNFWSTSKIFLLSSKFSIRWTIMKDFGQREVQLPDLEKTGLTACFNLKFTCRQGCVASTMTPRQYDFSTSILLPLSYTGSFSLCLSIYLSVIYIK